MGSSFPEAVSAAVAGLRHTFRTQRNFRVQCVLGAGATVAGLALGLSTAETAVVLLTAALVLASELVNTSLESIVDLQTEEWKPAAKAAKDAAAAAVLLLAGAAAFVGALILLPAALSRIGVAAVWWLRPAVLVGALVAGAIAVWARGGAVGARGGAVETVSGRVID